MCLELGISMDSNQRILRSVADAEMGTAITANSDLLPGAPASFFLARDDITVGSPRHASVQGDIQVPAEENTFTVSQKKIP